MLPFLNEKFGNASSVHSFGQEARAAVDKARRQVASLIKARANEIVFTSGGTEANNLAIRGLGEAHHNQGKHIIVSAIEHPSVRGLIDGLEKQGWEITRLPVYDDGLVRLADVAGAIRPDTILISVMMANNEIGTIQPVTEIGEIVREERKARASSLVSYRRSPKCRQACDRRGRARLRSADAVRAQNLWAEGNGSLIHSARTRRFPRSRLADIRNASAGLGRNLSRTS
jgi:hypothetical protein